jgi:hypothetical protein
MITVDQKEIIRREYFLNRKSMWAIAKEAVEHTENGKQSGCAIPLVIGGPGPAPALFMGRLGWVRSRAGFDFGHPYTILSRIIHKKFLKKGGVSANML